MDFRDSNTAGSPLPLLPRRTSSAHRSTFATPSTSTIPPRLSPPITLVVQHATPPDEDADGSPSSSSSEAGRPKLRLRVKRVRGVRAPEQSTPTPLAFPSRRNNSPPETRDNDTTPRAPSRPLVYAPGGGIGLRALSTSHIPAVPSTPSPSKQQEDETPRIIRKKSGQPVKSSLKGSAPRIRGSLAVVIGGGNSKSAPSTPISRPSVHFDSQLEHVKLFLAEQKPLAVSRDGSPTDDTSGTDGEFPDWIYGRDTREEQGQLEMLVDVPPPAHELDVKLQALNLGDDGTSVTGTVAVRNLAFDKWLAVRFTFDDWQTTSEVTARYSHSLPGGAVDVFSFSIRLNDLLARIEGKVMVVAVRYTAAGREMWDNNGGKNYRATFRRVKPEAKKEQEEVVTATRANTSNNAKPRSPEREVADDLRTRLELVVKSQEGRTPVQLRAKKEAETVDKFKAGGSLAARYDFGKSSRNPWRPHQRAASHPVQSQSPSPPPSSAIPFPKQHFAAGKTKPVLGSPRDASEDASDFRPAPYVASDSEDAPFSVPRVGQQQRNHQRGYFDVPLRDFGSLRRTPPGTPLRSLDDATPLPTPSRFNSFPPLDPRIEMGFMEMERRLASREESVSEGSTPSYVSGSSDTSGTTSPVSPPDYVALGLAIPRDESPTMYHSFLDKFCFYTGPEALAIEGLPRTQSVSSVEELLSVSSSHPLVAKPHSPIPVRFGDTGSNSSRGSGSTTPTSSSFATLSESRSATPVAAA
ncbi:CBM21 domain-containing protein [Favolaschia claudopus]|uniref:CBM21 domain-containing protein n=1 Tax=Favolaschia claudopus TaxID=2862362 RepID=A0AAW0CAD8_9AGAR